MYKRRAGYLVGHRSDVCKTSFAFDALSDALSRRGHLGDGAEGQPRACPELGPRSVWQNVCNKSIDPDLLFGRRNGRKHIPDCSCKYQSSYLHVALIISRSTFVRIRCEYIHFTCRIRLIYKQKYVPIYVHIRMYVNTYQYVHKNTYKNTCNYGVNVFSRSGTYIRTNTYRKVYWWCQWVPAECPGFLLFTFGPARLSELRRALKFPSWAGHL